MKWRSVLLARAFQAGFPVLSRILLESPKLQFATKPVAAPQRITVPTRHGEIGALLYSPVPADVEASGDAGLRFICFSTAGRSWCGGRSRRTTSPGTSPVKSVATSSFPTTT